MCDYITLSKNDFGAIIWCPECHSYSLMFNNVVIYLNEFGLNEIQQILTENYTNFIQNDFDTITRPIVISTEMKGLVLCFSFNELVDLIALVQEAKISIYLHEKVGV